MNTPQVPRSDSSSFEKATMAEIRAVTSIEAGFATYPSDKHISQCDSIYDALVNGFLRGASTLIDALHHLNGEHPNPNSLGPGFVAELLEEGLNRGLTHHGITITEQKEEEKEGE